jgi:ElaB/YqjD/DUF883 family membrane-anchored ribosome-binding protein
MSDLKKDKKRLQDDLKKLVADTKDLLGSTASVADQAAKNARTRVEASLQTVQEQVEAGLSVAGDKVDEQLQEIDKRVRANPYKTMGVSFGVGIILGFLIGRK